MQEIVTIETNRSEYNAERAAENSCTVQELIDRLSDMDPKAKVVFSNDNGYTYGYVTTDCVDTY